MNKDNGHWVCTGDCNKKTNSHIGFVYKITHLPSGEFYLGKKMMVKKIKRQPLKGKIKKRITTGESDWRTYCGSSRSFGELIDIHGKEQFLFEIVKYCVSKSELAYEELKLQIAYDVLRNEKSHNGIINVRLSAIKTD